MPDSFDLAVLNEGERQTLGLLAQGHTAKSIANLTGRSIGSVNERLREARRKTGIGSSRELARIFAAQENRDEQIGVVPLSLAGAGAMPGTATMVGRGPDRKGIVLMVFALFSGIAALAMVPGLTTVPQDTKGDAEFNITFPESRFDTRNLYAQLRRETRNEAWAVELERAIGARYAKVAHTDRMRRPVRVICGSTICEVAGVLPTGDDKLINDTMREMQGAALNAEMEQLGLKSGSQLFDKGSFIAYWLRADAPAR